MKAVELVILMRDKTKAALVEAGRNVDGLEKEYDQLVKAIVQTEKAAQRSDNAFGGLKKLLATIGGTAALVNFGKQIVEVRSQMQMMEKSFEVLTGSAEGSAKIMEELRSLAVKSPLELSSITDAAQMLMAYNLTADESVKVVKQLSDISMGEAGKFQSLALAFAQMSSAGQVLSQDMRQMATAGFNPLVEVAKNLGKEVSEVMDMMHDGKITVEMVTQAFETATSAGGKFYGMTEKQAEGLAGLQASMKDAWVSMMNEIGQSNEGVIASGLKMTTSLINNYETIGKALVSLIATYGTFKAALIVSTIVENARAMGGLANAIKATTVAQKLLNSTMLANPYVAVAALVAALTGILISAALSTNELKEAHKRLQESVDEFNKAALSEERQLALLKAQLENAKKGTDEYNSIKEKIIKNYGQYYAGLANEIEAVGMLETTYNKLTEAIRKSFGARQYDQFIQQEQKSLDEKMSKNLGKIQERLMEKLGVETGSKIYTKIYEAVINGTKIDIDNFRVKSGLDQETLDALDKASGYTGKLFSVSHHQVEEWIQGIQDAVAAFEYVDEKAKTKFGITDTGQASPDPSKGEEKEIQKFKTLTETVKEAQASVDELQKKLAGLRSGDIKSDDYTKDIEETSKALEEAKKKLDLLTGVDRKADRAAETAAAKAKREAQQAADAAEKINDIETKAGLEREKNALENEQRLLDVKEDGFLKQQQQIELNHRKGLLEAKEYAQKLIEAQQDIERKRWEQGGKKGTFTPTTTTVGQLSEEQQKEVAALYDLVGREKAAATRDLYKKQLEQYRTYAQQRLDIEKKVQDDIAALRKTGASDENIREAQRQQQEALDKLDEEFAGRQETFKAFMEQIADMSLKELYRALEEARLALMEATAKTGANSEQTAVARQKIKKLQEEIKQDSKDISNENTDEYKKWDKTAKSISRVTGEIDGLLGEMDFLDEASKSALQAAMNVAGGTMAMITGIQTLSSAAAKSMKAVEKASVILAIIGAALTVVQGIMSMVASSDEQERRHRLEQIEIQHEYNMALMEQNRLLKEANSLFGSESIRKAASAYKSYTDAIVQANQYQKDLLEYQRKNSPGAGMIEEFEKGVIEKYGSYENFIQELMRVEKMTRKEAEAKIKELYDALNGLGNLWAGMPNIAKAFDENGIFDLTKAKAILNAADMEEAERQILQQLVDLGDASEAAMEDLRSYLEDTFGELGSSLMESLVNSIETDGVNAWEDFGDAGAKVIERLGEQLTYELFFAQRFKKLQADLEAVYGETTDPEAIAQKQLDLVSDFYNNIGNDMDSAKAFMEQWQKEAKQRGFDLWTGDEEDAGSRQSGRAGAFMTMTQDQGTKLEGLFTSVQMHMASIDEKMIDLSVAMYQFLDHLAAIREDTAYIRRLEDIAEDIAVLRRDGIKVK
jgi:tape measure domain-containing protein